MNPIRREFHLRDRHSKGLAMEIIFSNFSMSHQGLQRESNEDFLLVDEELGLYGVFDGMGGHRAGEVASRSAAEAFQDTIAFHISQGLVTPESTERMLTQAIQSANTFVELQANNSANLCGMGTTATVLFVDGQSATFSHIGDSRAYLIRDGQVQQLTEDHTLAAEMIREGHKFENENVFRNFNRCLTKAIGSGKKCEPDIFEIQLLTGDRLLICSDGVTRYFNNVTESVLLSGVADEEVATKLIDNANEQGGADNSTVIVISLSSVKSSTV